MISERILNDLTCWCQAKSDYESFSFVVDVWIVFPVSVVGIAGNTLSVVVLNHDSSVNYATTLLLGAIAIVDNVYLLSCLVYQTGKAICYGTQLLISLRSFYPQVRLSMHQRCGSWNLFLEGDEWKGERKTGNGKFLPVPGC